MSCSVKLLLDQNLSHRMVKALESAYPESSQVSLLGMDTSTDKIIWDYAQEHGYAIVTLDADFHEYSLLWKGPPLIIWLKCGNQPKQVILDKLLKNQNIIEQAALDTDIWCVEIY